MSRVTIFDKHGYMLGDLRVSTRRSWTRASSNVIGKCDFDISKRDAHARKKFLNYGNFVLVRHPKLPDWLGVIYPPRSWGYGFLSVCAYQAEKILAWRNTHKGGFRGSPGSIFRQILEHTNAVQYNEKPIRPNLIYDDNTLRREATGDNALSHVVNVAKTSGQDFEVTHDFVNGRLVLIGNWYKSMGLDTHKYFREGRNIESSGNAMQETGELFNDVTGESDASTEASRFPHTEIDTAAIADYGLYQTRIIVSGVTDMATLQASVLETLKKTINPLRTIDVFALDIEDTFSYLSIGNKWMADINSAGFSGDGFGAQLPIEIMGMEHDDTADKKVRIIGETQDDY